MNSRRRNRAAATTVSAHPAMTYKLLYGTLVERPRRPIHIVRIVGAGLEPWQIDEIADRVRDRTLSRIGEPDLVLIQGDSRETLRLYGEPYSVSRVRTALFNAAVSWRPLDLA